MVWYFESKWKHSIPEEDIQELYNYVQKENAPNASSNKINRVFPLYCAVYQQDINKIKSLLKDGAQVDFYKEKRVTSLFMAIYHENIEIIKLLLDAGADVNLSTRFGLTPLWVALCTENMEIIDLLLEHKADATVNAKRGLSLLNFAFKNVSDEVALKVFESAPISLSLLESTSISKIISTSNAPETLLIDLVSMPTLENELITKILSASKDAEALLKTLIEHGLDINRQKDKYEAPLLSCAVEEENLELIKLFIKHKANKDIPYYLYFSYVPNSHYSDFEARGLFDPIYALGIAKGKNNQIIIDYLSGL